jgi:hypothetical protein
MGFLGRIKSRLRGLLDSLQESLLRLGLERLGKAAGSGAWWFATHKLKFGIVFLVVWGWAEQNGCSPLFNLWDVTQYVSCDMIQRYLGYLGSFLVGAGAIKSDKFYKDRR